MTNEIYKCDKCGNTVSLIDNGGGELVCCGAPMRKLQEISGEHEGEEKHIPIIEKTEDGILVKVGSVPHPMEDDHYINLIQLVKGDTVIIGKRLKPGDKPEALFCCLAGIDGLTARALCNKHGLWISR